MAQHQSRLNEAGADAFAAFASVIQTLLKKSAPPSVVEAMANLFRSPQGRPDPG